jgi:hypothetical protein
MAKQQWRSNVKEFKQKIKKLGTDFKNSAKKALNKAGQTHPKSALKEMVNDVKRDMGGLRKPEIKQSFNVDKAKTKSLFFRIKSGRDAAKRIPLYKAAKGIRQTGAGVSYTLNEQKKQIPGAFIATMASGHTGIFQRARNSRWRAPSKNSQRKKSGLPINEMHGPSITAVVTSRENIKDRHRKAVRIFNDEFDAALDQRLRKRGLK